MTEPAREHRLHGLEPDNLLAFLALLGVLRALENARPAWRPRARWDVETPPLRPVIHLRESLSQAEVGEAAAEGTATLAEAHAFGGKADLNHRIGEAREALEAAREAGRPAADLLAALMSDAAVKVEQGKRTDQVEATPLCLLFGQGHQHFLDRLAAVPRQPAPPPRGRGRKAVELTAAETLTEALFQPWARSDPTFSFRWDPAEDVRYALMFGDPSNASNKEGTQHGANRLAALGLAVFTAAPAQRGGQVRLAIPGGAWDGGFSLAWPIWREPASLDAIRALLAHPDLRKPGALAHLGLDHVRVTRRHSVGKFMNFSPARLIATEQGAAPV